MTQKVISNRVWKGWCESSINELDERSKIAKLPQGEVEYSVKGEGEALVVCHASPGGYDQAELLSAPYEKDHRVITWSRPGYLRTPIDSGASFSEQAELLATLIDYLWIDKAFVYGISSGCFIVNEFANQYPERCKAIVLESPIHSGSFINGMNSKQHQIDQLFFISQEVWFKELFDFHYLKTPQRQNLSGTSYFDELYIREILSADFDTEFISQLINLLKTTGPDNVRKLGMLNDVYQLTHTESLNIPEHIPVFIVVGENDHYQTKEFIRSGKNVHIIDNAGHIISLSENRKNATQMMSKFIKQHTSNKKQGV